MDGTDTTEQFLRLLSEHERKIGAYVMTLVPNASDAQDILQETKVMMWRKIGQFEPGTNFVAWGRKIAFHQILNYRRKRKRDRLEFSDAFLEAVDDSFRSRQQNLDRRGEALQQCLGRLPAEHRNIVALRYRDESPIERIAKRTGKTVAAVYRSLSRIRRVLHTCISQALEPSNPERPNHDRA